MYKLVPMVLVGKMKPADLAVQYDKDVAATHATK